MLPNTDFQSTHFQIRPQNPIQRVAPQVGRLQNRKVRTFVEVRRLEEVFEFFPKATLSLVVCGVGMLACQILGGEGGYYYLIPLVPGLFL